MDIYKRLKNLKENKKLAILESLSRHGDSNDITVHKKSHAPKLKCMTLCTIIHLLIRQA